MKCFVPLSIFLFLILKSTGAQDFCTTPGMYCLETDKKNNKNNFYKF
jgi:hypothetical protein